jgi:hypothetical protein
MIVYGSANCQIRDEYCVPKEHENMCSVLLDALSFGYAHRTRFYFYAYYDPNHANFNFEEPKIPDYYQTPRSILKDVKEPVEPEELELAPKPEMPAGYNSNLMRQFVDKKFPLGYHRLAWDYPCRSMSPEIKYVHPNGERTISDLEFEVLYGIKKEKAIQGCPPERILDYLCNQVTFFENKAWGDANFEYVYRYHLDSPELVHHERSWKAKYYDFIFSVPNLVHPASVRAKPPKAKRFF